jgi:L,D-peptidoglycan transpeptidase YkuD (ErfK/YbiS/YcfS/YnhG family)
VRTRLASLAARIVVVGVGAACCCSAPGWLSAAGASTEVQQRMLGGVPVTLRADTTQVVTVNHTRGYHARVGFWVLREGHWRELFAVRDGRIGYGGLARPLRRVQGSGTTPLGTVRLISAFGSHRDQSGWDLPYRRIRPDDYWVEDNGSRFYNRYRNRANGGFRWWLPSSRTNSSERLQDFPVQYEYSVVTSYNREQVRHRGAGIFLHVNGAGATAGCVSAPRSFLRRMMWRLDPVKDPLLAVGR